VAICSNAVLSLSVTKWSWCSALEVLTVSVVTFTKYSLQTQAVQRSKCVAVATVVVRSAVLKDIGLVC
jgi:hypothetical protein